MLALLPGFLVSGKIQGSVKTAKDFARQQDELIKNLAAVDAWGKGGADDKGSGYVVAQPPTYPLTARDNTYDGASNQLMVS